MGNKCKPCSKNTSQQIQYFKSKSQQAWVRKLNLDDAEKYIVSAKNNNQQQKSYYYLHDTHNYLKGIIYSSQFDSFYEGEINNTHQADGKGEERFKIEDQLDGQNRVYQGYYRGQFKRNARHGKGKYQDDILRFQGDWKNGYPVAGQLQIKEKPLKNITHSKHLMLRNYKVSQLQFNTRQMATGSGCILLPDESKYEGQFVKNNNNRYVLEGRGILTMPNKDIYDGMFKDGYFHGMGTYIVGGASKDKAARGVKKYVGEYKNGLKDGDGKLYIDRKYIAGKWIKGKKEGVFNLHQLGLNNKDNQILSQIIFHDDQQEGAPKPKN